MLKKPLGSLAQCQDYSSDPFNLKFGSLWLMTSAVGTLSVAKPPWWSRRLDQQMFSPSLACVIENHNANVFSVAICSDFQHTHFVSYGGDNIQIDCLRWLIGPSRDEFDFLASVGFCHISYIDRQFADDVHAYNSLAMAPRKHMVNVPASSIHTGGVSRVLHTILYEYCSSRGRMSSMAT